MKCVHPNTFQPGDVLEFHPDYRHNPITRKYKDRELVVRKVTANTSGRIYLGFEGLSRWGTLAKVGKFVKTGRIAA